MTKEKYMALADFQTLWTSELKPWINTQVTEVDEKHQLEVVGHKLIVIGDSSQE